MNAPKFFIYGLVDPRSGDVRYIGKSATGMRRPLMHAKSGRLAKDLTHKGNWIRALHAEGFTYGVEILEAIAAREELNNTERYWILEARKHGWQLTNHTDGGDGLSGAVFSAEHRAKISAANKGRKLTEEQRRKISEVAKRRSPAYAMEKVAQMRAAWQGKKHTTETKAKIGAAHRGKVLSTAQRAAVSAANSKAIRELGSGQVFPSARAAAKALNLEYSGIVKVAAGNGRLKSHHGYRFEYLP